MVGSWGYAGLAVVALGVAAFFAAAALTQARARENRATAGLMAAHALMAAAMAAMFGANPLPPYLGALVFVLIGAWFVTVRVRGGGRGIDTRGVDEPTHLAIGSAAMVVMYLGLHAASAGAGGGGHAGHGGTEGTASAGWLPAVVLGLAFAGYFVWHAWETVAAPRPSGSAAPGRTGVLAGPRPRVAAHVAADALMAVMFLDAL